MTEEEIKLLKDENAALKGEVERLKDELVRMVSRNLDLSERLEYDVELRRVPRWPARSWRGISNVSVMPTSVTTVS